MVADWGINLLQLGVMVGVMVGAVRVTLRHLERKQDEQCQILKLHSRALLRGDMKMNAIGEELRRGRSIMRKHHGETFDLVYGGNNPISDQQWQEIFTPPEKDLEALAECAEIGRIQTQPKIIYH